MLSGGSNVDLWPDFDAIDNVAQGQVDAAVALEGLYEGISLLDLGAVYTSRLTASIDADGVDFRSNVDLIQNVDAIDNFDGADPSTWNVALLVKLSDDAVTFGDWRPFTVGDYTARALLRSEEHTSELQSLMRT